MTADVELYKSKSEAFKLQLGPKVITSVLSSLKVRKFEAIQVLTSSRHLTSDSMGVEVFIKPKINLGVVGIGVKADVMLRKD